MQYTRIEEPILPISSNTDDLHLSPIFTLFQIA